MLSSTEVLTAGEWSWGPVLMQRRVGVGLGETERRLGLAHLESLLQKGHLALAKVDIS